MGPDEYLIGGFAAMFAVTVLFPVHCCAIGGTLIVTGVLLGRKF